MWRIGVWVATVGCAHASFEPRIAPHGPYRPADELARAAAAIPVEDLRTVSVWRGPLPPGLILDGDRLVVADPERFELVATVTAAFEPQRALGASLSVAFYRYAGRESWRNGYCNVQVPLGWATVGLWSLVPLHWPCMIVETAGPVAADRRRDRILEALVRGTKAAGGDLLVLGAIEDGSGLEAATGRGFALRDRGR